MAPVAMHMTALGVAAIYYLWRDGYHAKLIRKRILHGALRTCCGRRRITPPNPPTAPNCLRAARRARPVAFLPRRLTRLAARVNS